MMSFAPLMTPTLTGRSTVLMLFVLLSLPGTNARSGMNAPKGTPMNRLLSTSQTEYTSPTAGAGAGAVSAPTATATTSTAKPITNQNRLLIVFPHSDSRMQFSDYTAGYATTSLRTTCPLHVSSACTRWATG